MPRLLQQLILDEAGFVQSAELVLIATITVLGMIVGLTEVSSNVNNELLDVGQAFNSVNQSYSSSSASGSNAWAGNSQFINQPGMY